MSHPHSNQQGKALSDENATKMQTLLRQMRQSFVNEMPERLQAMEKQVEALAQADGAPLDEKFYDFFRAVHSLKGTGGTFGLHIISSICHQLEDYLERLPLEPASFNPHFVDACIRFLDLLHRVADMAASGDENFDGIAKQLASFDTGVSVKEYSALMVVSSKLARSMCRHALNECQVHVIGEGNSHEALLRALTQPFDIIIVSSELAPLKGEAMIAAIQLSKNIKDCSKTVLITTNKTAMKRKKRDIDPDYIVARNAEFYPNIKKAIQQIVTELSASA